MLIGSWWRWEVYDSQSQNHTAQHFSGKTLTYLFALLLVWHSHNHTEQIWDISWYSNYTEANMTKPLQTHVYTISSNFFPNCICSLTSAVSAVIVSLLSKQSKEEEYTMNSKKSLITDCQSL